MTTTTTYRIEDTGSIITPALIVFRETVEANIDEMIRIAGRPERLRPHCKTHKMRETTRLQLDRGITRHKAATFAEAEMLAQAGVTDICLAYNLVGPNIARAARFVQTWPRVTFSATADHVRPLEELSRAMTAAGCSMQVLVDIDAGQHRTGLPPGEAAFELYRCVVDLPGVAPGGLHIYDGHQHQRSVDDRRAAVRRAWEPVAEFRESLHAAGWDVPRLLFLFTGSFPVYAEMDDPAIECSPGTCVFHDGGYAALFPDLNFTPAAVVLTRVISRPGPDRVTFDAGTKGVASDPPFGRRLLFPNLPDAEQVLQNEEHLVLRTDRADEFVPGDELFAIPTHICPTSALHKEVYVVSGGKVCDRWSVVARDRWLTI